MKKAKHIGLIALCLAAVCLICFLFGRSVGKSAGISEVDAVVLENKLTEISELASITYSYTNMAEFENSKDFYGIKLPFTTKGFIITYDGEIKAGIDLSKAEVSVSGQKVSITLPDAEILSHQIDEDSLEIFDETTSIFNPLKVTDYNSFNRDQKAEMEKKATEKGLLTEAKKKAADTVKGFILQLVPEDWTVEVA
ncbi:DUF4230 domain-containing protein [Anaerovoracaceae bacterium 42-11]|nr:DUF4230 domain-containing protein [Emergencia sp.]